VKRRESDMTEHVARCKHCGTHCKKPEKH
jgi:hypothetical protein